MRAHSPKCSMHPVATSYKMSNFIAGHHGLSSAHMEHHSSKLMHGRIPEVLARLSVPEMARNKRRFSVTS